MFLYGFAVQPDSLLFGFSVNCPPVSKSGISSLYWLHVHKLTSFRGYSPVLCPIFSSNLQGFSNFFGILYSVRLQAAQVRYRNAISLRVPETIVYIFGCGTMCCTMFAYTIQIGATVTENLVQHLPYAPPTAVLAVIRRFRDRGLTQPVTKGTLEQVGVSTGNASRTLQTLKFLALVGEDGNVTDEFQRLRRANTDEYPETFAEILRSAYHPIFNIVEPVQDDATAIEDAFRGFEPSAQRQRMVTLFLGLCFEAGLVTEDKAPRMQSQPRQQKSSPKPSRQKSQRPKTPPDPPPVEERNSSESDSTVAEYPVVQAVVQQLPKNAKWTQKRRNLWVQAMTSAVDLAIEVGEEETVYEGEVMPELELE